LSEQIIIGLAAIIVLGIFAQWVAWHFKLPSILLLLLFGFIVGPFTGYLQPDKFFGELLFPFVSISVAIILFEGGLSLKLDELKPIFKVVRNLITIGTLVTWSLTSLAAYYFIPLTWNFSVLLGAILVVTGPTVIMPLLRLVKPKGQINSILKWEGIVNDPIGAMLALLVFETIISTGFFDATLTTGITIFKTVVISSAIGVIGAYLLVFLLKKDYIPDFLQNPSSLAIIILVFALANTIQSESGLFAVTIMGIILANQHQVVVEHIIEFKENLRVLLLSSLFIVLAARLKLTEIALLQTGSFIFVGLLIFAIRPLTIFASTIGSHLNWKEKLYLSWMAPRGIVAAAVTSIFALELEHHGIKGAEILVPIMFLIIVSTIVVYGLSAIPLAKVLHISDIDPQGILIVGINHLSKDIYKILKKYNIKVLLVDNNWDKVTNTRREGIDAMFGSIVSEKTLEHINLEGIGKFIAFTPNKGINSLAAIYFSRIFESADVYQINTAPKFNQDLSKELRSNYLSSQKLEYPLLEHYDETIKVKATKITEEYSFDNFIEQYGNDNVYPLFILSKDNKLTVFSDKNQPKPKNGETLITVILNENVKLQFNKQESRGIE